MVGPSREKANSYRSIGRTSLPPRVWLPSTTTCSTTPVPSMLCVRSCMAASSSSPATSRPRTRRAISTTCCRDSRLRVWSSTSNSHLSSLSSETANTPCSGGMHRRGGVPFTICCSPSWPPAPGNRWRPDAPDPEHRFAAVKERACRSSDRHGWAPGSALPGRAAGSTRAQLWFAGGDAGLAALSRLPSHAVESLRASCRRTCISTSLLS
jgi:hypothetical protein